MAHLQASAPDRRDFLKGAGVILVSWALPGSFQARADGMPFRAGSIPDNQVDSFLAIAADGQVTVFNGHVDLGTGVRTALGQIAAEELDLPFDHVAVVLGDTDWTPNQGPTIASATIQIAAIPLRQAAAQARQYLLNTASDRLNVPVAALILGGGMIWARDDANKRVSYGDLIEGRHFNLQLSGTAPLKDPAEYKVVGTRVPRVDIPSKVMGKLTYVHDLRLPGMLRARVIRPPYAGVDSGAPIGQSLISVDAASVKEIPGIVRVVVIKDFIGIVAEREENAIAAAQALKVQWKPWAGLPDLADLEVALRAHPSTPRTLEQRD